MATNSGGWLYEPTGTPVDKATADNAQARVLEIKQTATSASTDATTALSRSNTAITTATQAKASADATAAGQAQAITNAAQAKTDASTALVKAEGAVSTADNAADRVDALEVMGGVQPGSVNDANMKLHAEQDGGLFNTALKAQMVQGLTDPDASFREELNRHLGLFDPTRERQALTLTYRGGWVANRISVGGVYGEDMPQLAPFIEVTPALPAFNPPDSAPYPGSWQVSDDGASDASRNKVDPVSGYQLYRVGNGDTVNREFLAWEAFGHSTVHGGEPGGYKFVVTRSGTGKFRPLMIGNGFRPGLTIPPNSEIVVGTRLFVDDSALDDSIRVWRNSPSTAFEIRTANTGVESSQIFFSKARGTIEAPLPPNSGDNLGDIRMGHRNSSGAFLGGVWRMTANENWAIGSRHGTRAELRIAPKGGTATIPGLVVDADSESPSVRVSRNYAQTVNIRSFAASGEATTLLLGRARGTEDAPQPPLSGNALADVAAGMSSSSGDYIGGVWRMRATEDWAVGSKHGTRAQVRVTPTGQTGMVTGLEVAYPFASLDTSMTLLVNRNGTVTEHRVTVGAADSGGTGFRSLRIPN